MEGVVVGGARFFRRQPVLITGAGGFIGRRLTLALAQAGADVTIVELPSADLSALDNLLAADRTVIGRVHRAALDIREGDALCTLVSRIAPAYVFHLAAVGVTDPFVDLELALSVNLVGTIHLLRACFDRSPGDTPPIRLVHTGTPYEYGDSSGEPYPLNPYGASKAAAFAFARMFHRTRNWPIVTVRPFQVYGPGQPESALIPAAMRAARAGERFRMTAGEQERDFIYVDDVVRGYLRAASRGRDGQSYDLGWGKTYKLRDVITCLYQLMGGAGTPDFGALPYRPGEVWRLQADPRAASRDLRWGPEIPLDKGLALTAASAVVPESGTDPNHDLGRKLDNPPTHAPG
jgi:nucleoside-diphosphate-sugar epimerase